MVSNETFRSVVGNFATGVTVVSVSSDGDDHGMTVNAFSSVSLDPPLVLFCADKETTTHDLVADASQYVVNILTRDQEWISSRFAGSNPDMEDPFEDVSVTRGTTGSPIIQDTIAYLECTVETSYEAGDHTIYIGHVENLGLQNSDEPPLTFYQGEYGTTTE